MPQAHTRNDFDERRHTLQRMKRTLVRAELLGHAALALSSAILELERDSDRRSGASLRR